MSGHVLLLCALIVSDTGPTPHVTPLASILMTRPAIFRRKWEINRDSYVLDWMREEIRRNKRC